MAGPLLSPGPQPVAPNKYIQSECQRCARQPGSPAQQPCCQPSCQPSCPPALGTGPHLTGHGKGQIDSRTQVLQQNDLGQVVCVSVSWVPVNEV